MPQTAEKLLFLRATVNENPEYAEILPLFQELYATIEGREGETGISFATSEKYAAQRVTDGFPLLQPDSMQVDPIKTGHFLTTIIDALLPMVKDGADELCLLREAIGSDKLDLRTVLAACLARDRRTLEEAAAAIGMSSPLLEFALEPVLKTALETFSETMPASCAEGWQEGYCPICGSRAGMGELTGEEGKRQLSCSTCFYKWPYKRMKCPYCSNEDHEALSYFSVGEGPTRVDVCRKCSRYLKTRDSRLGHAGVPLDAEDLATIHLDLVASKEGFERGI